MIRGYASHRPVRLRSAGIDRGRWRRLGVLCLGILGAAWLPAGAADWVRAGLTTNAPVWGLAGGLQFALHPGGFSGGDGGPRGLIRLGYPVLPGGEYDLINFIAVEPVVTGRRGFSELEKSPSDGGNGLRFWTGMEAAPGPEASRWVAGEVTRLASGQEELVVDVAVERFANGAHVRLRLAQRSDRPDEWRFTVSALPDSAPLAACILTATMGNKARTRILWLADGPVSSLQLYPDYRESGFAPHRRFGIDRLPRLADGDVLVPFANDEADPASVQPFGRPHFWDYRGRKVTQYWRKPAAGVGPELALAVNARFTYWMSERPIPGGIAFENVEWREPFRDGQTVLFGITRGNPLAAAP